MTSLENILLYYNMSKSNSTTHQILRQCLQVLPKTATMTIQELADYCYTSTATITRLLKNLGYQSYYAFQQALSDCLSRYPYHNRFVLPKALSEDPTQNLNDYLSVVEGITAEARKLSESGQLTRIAQSMHQASQVAIFSYGILFCEMSLQSDLFMSGIPCDIFLDDITKLEAAGQLPENSFSLILFPACIDGYTVTERIMKLAKDCNSTVCLVSSSVQAAFYRLADIFINFEGHNYVTDALFVEMFLSMLAIVHRQIYLDAFTPPPPRIFRYYVGFLVFLCLFFMHLHLKLYGQLPTFATTENDSQKHITRRFFK